MAKPGEHKTVQARILAYAQEIGWTYVPRVEAERRRGLDHSTATPAEQAAETSPYFEELLFEQVRRFNPRYADGPGALVGDLRRLRADITGNRELLAYLRNSKTFYDREAAHELNLVLIEYEHPDENVFDVTEELAFHNGQPLGYKAFLVGVDRLACAKYKAALDKYLPKEYSEVVFTGNNNDPQYLKDLHLDTTRERQIRKEFANRGDSRRS